MQETEALVKVIKTDDAIVGLRKDGIVHVYFRPCTKITVELQWKLIEVYDEITGGKKHPFIFEAGEFVTLTKEARDNALIIEEATPTAASAVVAKTWVQRLIAEFYVKVKQPRQRYKVVSKFSKGIDWLAEINQEVVSR